MQIDTTIKGTNAILLHKYTTASVSTPPTRIVRGTDSKNYADEWVKGTYLNTDGFVVMPAINIMACMFNGAKGMKKGKTPLTRLVYTSFQVQPFEPILNYDNKPITLEDIEKNDWLNVCGVVIQGRRVDRTRTEIPLGWEINFQIITKDESLTSKDIRMILENAGTVAGLGDWRPSSPKKPGPYGTFQVVKFE